MKPVCLLKENLLSLSTGMLYAVTLSPSKQARDMALGEQQQGRVAFGGACATL